MDYRVAERDVLGLFDVGACEVTSLYLTHPFLLASSEREALLIDTSGILPPPFGFFPADSSELNGFGRSGCVSRRVGGSNRNVECNRRLPREALIHISLRRRI